jgi:hypothetical protein
MSWSEFRALCAELLQAVDTLIGQGESPANPGVRLILTVHLEDLEDCANRTRAALAQTEMRAGFDPRLVVLATTSEQIPPGPWSEHQLRTQWNAQADEFNQWESLDLSEQLAWAQARAIGAKLEATARAADIQYMKEHGGLTASAPDGIHAQLQAQRLTGLRAVAARYAHPTIQPVAVSELVDLAHELRKTAEYLQGGCGWVKALDAIERAASLIESGAIQRFAPIPVSERWPEFSDCDPFERVWALNPVLDHWKLTKINRSIHTHWLPHWALPIPC